MTTQRVIAWALWFLAATGLLLALAIYCACASKGTLGVAWDTQWHNDQTIQYATTTRPAERNGP